VIFHLCCSGGDFSDGSVPDNRVFRVVWASRRGLICILKILPSFDYTQAKMLTTEQDDGRNHRAQFLVALGKRTGVQTICQVLPHLLVCMPSSLAPSSDIEIPKGVAAVATPRLPLNQTFCYSPCPGHHECRSIVQASPSVLMLVKYTYILWGFVGTVSDGKVSVCGCVSVQRLHTWVWCSSLLFSVWLAPWPPLLDRDELL
jgi:hypothetical protein